MKLNAFLKWTGLLGHPVAALTYLSYLINLNLAYIYMNVYLDPPSSFPKPSPQTPAPTPQPQPRAFSIDKGECFLVVYEMIC